MGTRFLLTSDSTVPDAVKQVYLSKAVTETVVTTQIDGVPHRVLKSELVDQLAATSTLTALPRAIRNAIAFQRLSSTPWTAIAREGLAMRRSQGLSWSQVVMAANTPMLLKAAMVDGRPDLGVMSSGQVVGVLDDLPTCAEVVRRVMAEAEATLSRLAP
jgi:NAD(P)H-dependent flavin oxidoreductase YrpB (nitropropane dioxygenase family)